MEKQQYTIQILDKDESTDLVTSKQSCLIGRSLISDIRIHLPSIKEMHLEIDMKNKRVTSYGRDVKVKDVEVEVNGSVDYEYGDVISLRNKRFVVHMNKEHREGSNLPLVVPAENAFEERVQPPGTSLKGRFNMSPSRPRRSEESCAVIDEEEVHTGTIDETGSRAGEDGRQRQEAVRGRDEAQPEPEKSARPSFFNATDSSIDTVIAREKELLDCEIKNNIEFDVSALQTSVPAKSTKPMDLKDAVLEKAVLEDIMESKQNSEELERTVRDLAGKGCLFGAKDEKGQESVLRSSEKKVLEEARDSDGDEMRAVEECVPSNVVKIRKEVLLVTERTVSTLGGAPPESASQEVSTELAENEMDTCAQTSKEVPRVEGVADVSRRAENVETGVLAGDANPHTERGGQNDEHRDRSSLEQSAEETPAGEDRAEDKEERIKGSAKRRIDGKDFDEEPSQKRAEMAGTKYGSASRQVEKLVGSLNKEEKRRAKMGVLVKKTGPADSTREGGEMPQKRDLGSHRKEEKAPGREKNFPEAEVGASRQSEGSFSAKKTEKKKNSLLSQKGREMETAEEPLKKKTRLASAASLKDAAAPKKSRRRAAVAEKTPKARGAAQQSAAKKDAPQKKTSETTAKKKSGKGADKKKARKASKK